MIIYLSSIVISLLAILIPFKWGQEPERQGAKVAAAMMLLSILRTGIFGTQLDGFDHLGILVDLIGFAGFLVIALFALRVWPLWASALQLIAVTSHLVQMLQIEIHPAAYVLMVMHQATL